MPDITATIVPDAQADIKATAKDSQTESPEITLTESSATGGTALGQAVADAADADVSPRVSF